MPKKSYKAIYKKYHSSPDAIRERARRNHDRLEAQKKGLVHKGDGKEVDHPAGDARGPTRVISRKANRAAGARKANRRKGRENRSA